MNAHISAQSISATAERPLVRIVIVGHVDHGKSTLIGRLLHETGSLPDGKFESLKAVSARRGMPFEWSFLLDALQTERDQGITIDTSQIRFRTASRDFVLIDAPGHVEFLRNMITGAAQADGAILLIDASEGVREQTRRHGYLLHLLGIRQVAVVVNKMDRVDFSAERFTEIANEIGGYLTDLGIKPVATIPISARQGDGVSAVTPAIAWYQGPAVLGALDRFSPATPARDLALRLPVQAVYKFDDRRIIVGRIESGRISVGDEIVVMPGAKLARVKSIESWPAPVGKTAIASVDAGRSVGITLDRELFIERGHLLSLSQTPSDVSTKIRSRIFWLHSTPLEAGATVTLRSGTAEARGRVATIAKAVDPGELQNEAASAIRQNHVGEIEIELTAPLAGDPYTINPLTGRFALEIDGRICGGGLILDMKSAQPTRLRSAQYLRNAEDLTAQVAALQPQLAGLDAEQRLVLLRKQVEGRIVFTTSFGVEDQAILQLISKAGLDIDVVTLDTGRLFPETYEVWAATERHFGRRIRALYPRRDELEALVARQGIDGFYESREARNACCFVRKVEPLTRALGGAQGWVVGLRGDQSANRQDMAILSADASHNLLKLSPLFDWSRDRVVEFTTKHGVPVNALHAKGFASIGCAPCTRALRPGEPERAGRWWWEDETKKECGLHVAKA
jgi:sulfate adenylyltransferase large subunit/phosphoadenylyl-sulfate reductase (thioredoxin)